MHPKVQIFIHHQEQAAILANVLGGKCAAFHPALHLCTMPHRLLLDAVPNARRSVLGLSIRSGAYHVERNLYGASLRSYSSFFPVDLYFITGSPEYTFPVLCSLK